MLKSSFPEKDSYPELKYCCHQKSRIRMLKSFFLNNDINANCIKTVTHFSALTMTRRLLLTRVPWGVKLIIYKILTTDKKWIIEICTTSCTFDGAHVCHHTIEVWFLLTGRAAGNWSYDWRWARWLVQTQHHRHGGQSSVDCHKSHECVLCSFIIKNQFL